ncbi:MAG: large repetitive protein, partial [Gaiellaceae bacterium]|nr:large repetitive protein [Gaiellaceae bacterium]
LGSGGSTLTVGGDALLAQLPPTRQAEVLQFDQSPATLTSIIGGSGADTFRIISTTALLGGRAGLNSQLGLVSISPAGGSTQHLSISSITDHNGWFTVKDQYLETKAMPLSVDLGTLQTELQRAFLGLIGTAGNLTVTTAGDGFNITFAPALGTVAPLVAQVIPLLVNGGGGTDRLRVQSVFEDTFFNGGDGSDSADVNFNAITLEPFHPTDVVGHVVVNEIHAGAVGQNEVQRVTLNSVTGGTYELVAAPNAALGIAGGTTSPLAWDAPALAVQTALEALYGQQNVGVTQSGNTYTIEFIGALAAQQLDLLTSNVVALTTQVGDATHDAVQQVTLQSVSGGTFNLDYTYDVRPLGLATDPNAVGSLAAGTYYYRVTAVTGQGETLASSEVHTTVGTNGAVNLTWGAIADVFNYKIYRGTAAGGENVFFTSLLPSFFDGGTPGTSCAPCIPTTTNVHGIETTIPLEVGASNLTVQAALEQLPDIGAGNVLVSASTDSHGNQVYTVEFRGALGNRPIALLNGGVSTLRSEGLHAILTLDGENGGDTYNVNLIGGRTSALVNVFDTGALASGADSLTIGGTDYADVFLLRSATADDGLAFVALINGPTPLTPGASDPVERVNYNQALESITVNGGNGDDQFYVDDTRAQITLNGDQGNDFFQIGQLYQSRRTPALATVAVEDVFATINTTHGWLSNGISKPMTINGGIGDDHFIVFHNLDTLNLNGDAGNDDFLVQAFALAGSQEDHRALTDLSGGAGADLIQYAVNAPVNIDGGDGFDTVTVVGTEFNDDFVVTPTGVFGAGLNVNFVNIESLTVDGGAGDDRFFVLGTGPNFTTEIDGGLGSDLISVEGPTPGNGVISNDLLGHSGIITHGVESSVTGYNGIPVVGISANVADNDSPGVVVTQTGGFSQIVQSSDGLYLLSNGTMDQFTVVLTRPPVGGSVVVTATPPPGLAIVDGTTLKHTITDEVQVVTLTAVFSGGFTLSYGTGAPSPTLSWDAPASTVESTINALLGSSTVHVEQTGSSYSVTFSGGALHLHNANPLTAALVGATPGGAIAVKTSVDGGFATPEAQQLTFTASNWWQPQTVNFAVDAAAQSIPTNADFLNSIQVAGGDSTIGGTVSSAKSVDVNPTVVGDEYATLISSGNPFLDFLPSATLQEGLRGTQLKITGGDPEAQGQVRLVLGTYRQTLHLTGVAITLSFGSATVSVSSNDAAGLQAAVDALVGNGNGVVTGSGSDFTIELRGTLYLSNDAHFTATGATVAYDANSIKLSSPWTAEPQSPASFQISLFSGVKVPGVKVKVFSGQHPQVVVDESHGSTDVAQGDPAVATNVDTIGVRLSAAPTGAGGVDVVLGDHNQNLVTYWVGGVQVDALHPLHFSAADSGVGSWTQYVQVEVRAVDDGVVRGFHRTDLVATAPGYAQYLATITIADDNWYGVRVTESDGSTNVIEYSGTGGGDFGLTQGTASADGFPFQDSYTIALTKQLTSGQTVTVTTQAQPTRTSQTGGLVSFSQQLLVCVAGPACLTALSAALDTSLWKQTQTLTFDASTWNTPLTVYVRAVENDRVEGMDTHVFAPTLNQLNTVQGPLFLNGGEGTNRTGLLEREPVMLPGETNTTPPMGTVASSTPGSADGSIAATVTISHSSLATAPVVAENPARTVQDISVNAIGGSFTVSYGGATPVTVPFGTPSVTLQDILRAMLKALDPTADLTVAQNGSVYQVTFLHTTVAVSAIVTDASGLLPLLPADLVNATILVTSGAAKNKTRIVTGAIDSGGGHWTLTLDRAWFSPFNNDPSTPAAGDGYTLLTTNPNLLVKEQTQANLLFLYDTDNPASYNDPALPVGQTNPFGQGRMFYDTSPFGPAKEDGTIAPLNQFRIVGFGMGGDRCIGGPANAATGLCTGPVGANEPGGVTFKGFQDVELNLGAGANHFTVDDTPTNAITRINTGAGNDVVDVKKISGHTFVNLGAGDDTLNIHNDSQQLSDLLGLLTVSGDSPQANVVAQANGSAKQGTSVDAVDEIQLLTVDATGGTFTLTFTLGGVSQTTAAIAAGASAAAVAAALSALPLIHAVDSALLPAVDVRKAGTVYRVHFQNGLGGQTIPLLIADPTLLLNGAGERDVLNISDTGSTAAGGAAILTSSSLTGLDMGSPNQIQQLVVDATGGTFALTYSYAIFPTSLTATQQGAGTLTAGTHYYRVTAMVGGLESLASNEVQAVTANNGAVSLSWTGIAGALSYRLYRGDTQGGESAYQTVATAGGGLISFLDQGASGSAATLPTASDVVAQETTATPLAWNAAASDVQSALEALAHIGAGYVVVARNDDVYVIRFQGSLGGLALKPLTPVSSLTKVAESLGGAVGPAAPSATITTRDGTGSATPATNQVQVLAITATGGSYYLTFHVGSTEFTTDPIPYNASAEQVRQTIQNAIAVGETNDLNLRAYLVDKVDVIVDRYPSANLGADVYVLSFQGELRKAAFGSGLDTVVVHSSLTGTNATATVTTRMD